MAKLQIYDKAPAWNARRTYVQLWHGCTGNDYLQIMTKIDLSISRVDTDFGPGFYTTTLKRQARHWAWERYYALPYRSRVSNQPVVLGFRFLREDLAKLESMHFVRGDYDATDYWSLVQHCRQSSGIAINNHQHSDPARNGWYDMVGGPAASHWRQRTVIQGADQFSFHGNFIDRAGGLNDMVKSKSVKVTFDAVI